jgi:hypothetical protein
MSTSDPQMPLDFRRGISVIDVIAASVITTALVTLALQYAAATNDARRGLQQRQTALNQAENLMETLFAWDYQQITADKVAGLEQRMGVLETGEQARPFSVEIEEIQQPLAAKRITISVRGKNPAGGPAPPVQLTAWRFRTTAAGTP